MAHLPKQIDKKQVIHHLRVIFEKAVSSLPNNNSRGTTLHRYQTDFCYFIDEITRGPNYMVPKVISECNAFIDTILSDLNKKSK